MREAQGETTVRDAPRLGVVALRCAGGDAPALLGSVTAAPPLGVGECAPAGAARLLCLGPDEWLVVGAPAAVANAHRMLADAAVGVSHALVDLGDSRVAFDVVGPKAEELLAYGCPIDLDLSAFPAVRAMRTQFAGATVVVERLEQNAFRLWALRSYKPYLDELLRLAAAELAAETAKESP